MRLFYLALLGVALTVGFSSAAAACPMIDGFVDFNCDGEIKIAFTGDSIVYGRGDMKNGNQGGFVLRLDNRYPNVNIENIGVPGVTSQNLLRGFRKNLRRAGGGVTKRKSRDADMFVILVGVNDWWRRVPPGRVVLNIRRLVSFLKKELAEQYGSEPFIVVSTLLPNGRPGQREYVAEINRLLLRHRSPERLPVYFRADRLNPQLLDWTRLHPGTQGHQRLARMFARFLERRAADLMLAEWPYADTNGGEE